MRQSNEKKLCEICKYDKPGWNSIMAKALCEKATGCKPDNIIVPTGDKKICGTCNWHEDWTGACCNGDSEYRGDFTAAESTCDCWEGQNEQGYTSKELIEIGNSLAIGFAEGAGCGSDVIEALKSTGQE